MAASIRQVLSVLDAYKQPIKNMIGYLAFAAAPVAVYDIFKGNGAKSLPALTGNVSLILNGAVTPVGVAVISSIAHRFFTSHDLEKAFGANTIFAINPWHPRHVTSIAAFILLGPAVLKEAICLYGRVTRQPPFEEKQPQQHPWIRTAIVLSFIFSRVLLHVVNQSLQNFFTKVH